MGNRVSIGNKTYRALPSGRIQVMGRILNVPHWQDVPLTSLKTLEKVRAALAAK